MLYNTIEYLCSDNRHTFQKKAGGYLVMSEYVSSFTYIE